jgi:hypothetical protein
MKLDRWIVEQANAVATVSPRVALGILMGCLTQARSLVATLSSCFLNCKLQEVLRIASVVLAIAGAVGVPEAIAQPVDVAPTAKDLYRQRCNTIAGQKIYRKVKDVEGVLLLKIRPQASGSQLADPMWPGAAFALEAAGDGYIHSFLGFEYQALHGLTRKPVEVTQMSRGYISTDRREGGIPGYKYVDVPSPHDGKRIRYTGRWEEPWQHDRSYLKGYIKFFLDSAPAVEPAPRYAVSYEDHIIPEERINWIASSTVKVYDMQTKEVLGELIRYAWAGGGPTASSPAPWLRARVCPGHAIGSNAATRKFVDQVLIPKQGQ